MANKTIEQILDEVVNERGFRSFKDFETSYILYEDYRCLMSEFIHQAMRIAMEQAYDNAAERAEVKSIEDEFGNWDKVLDKQSILNLKYQII